MKPMSSFVSEQVDMPLPLEESGSLAAEAAIGFAIYKAAAPIRWPVTGLVTAAVSKYAGRA